MKTDGAPQRPTVDALLAAAAALVYDHGHAPGAFPGLCPVRSRCPHLAGRSARTLGAWAAVVGLMILGVGFMGGEAHSARGGPYRVVYVPTVGIATTAPDSILDEALVSTVASHPVVARIEGWAVSGQQVWTITQAADTTAAAVEISLFLEAPRTEFMTEFLLTAADAMRDIAMKWGRYLGRRQVRAGDNEVEVEQWSTCVAGIGEIVYSRWQPTR